MEDQAELKDVPVAAKRLGVSESYLNKQPSDTPGIYRFGRKKKIHLAEFMAWARQQAVDGAKARKGTDAA